MSENKPIIRVGLSREPVSLDDVAARLARETNGFGAGSLVVFMGFVKGVVGGYKVYTLSYEAYEDVALKKMEEIAREEAAKWEKTYAIWLIHRIGSLKPGDPTIYVFVVAEPRHKAFELASRILDRVKHEVPIYKLEAREDGEYWILGDHTRVRRGEGLQEPEKR